MRQSLRALEVNEDEVITRMQQARGDIFLAASMMGVSPTEITAYIKASESLQAAVLAISTVKEDPNWRRMSHQQFADRLSELSHQLRIQGLETIKEIAELEGWKDDAGLAKVKLKAAEILYGVEFHVEDHGRPDTVLRELDEAFRAHAPVIGRIRETVREIEFVSAQQEVPPTAAQRLPDPAYDSIPSEYLEPPSIDDQYPEPTPTPEAPPDHHDGSDNPDDAGA